MTKNQTNKTVSLGKIVKTQLKTFQSRNSSHLKSLWTSDLSTTGDIKM